MRTAYYETSKISKRSGDADSRPWPRYRDPESVQSATSADRCPQLRPACPTPVSALRPPGTPHFCETSKSPIPSGNLALGNLGEMESHSSP